MDDAGDFFGGICTFWRRRGRREGVWDAILVAGRLQLCGMLSKALLSQWIFGGTWFCLWAGDSDAAMEQKCKFLTTDKIIFQLITFPPAFVSRRFKSLLLFCHCVFWFVCVWTFRVSGDAGAWCAARVLGQSTETGSRKLTFFFLPITTNKIQTSDLFLCYWSVFKTKILLLVQLGIRRRDN